MFQDIKYIKNLRNKFIEENQYVVNVQEIYNRNNLSCNCKHDNEKKIIYIKHLLVDSDIGEQNLTTNSWFEFWDFQLCQKCCDERKEFYKNYNKNNDISIIPEYDHSLTEFCRYKKTYNPICPCDQDVHITTIRYMNQSSLDYHILTIDSIDDNDICAYSSDADYISYIKIFIIPLDDRIKSKIMDVEKIFQMKNILCQELIEIIIKYYHYNLYQEDIERALEITKYLF